MGIGGLSPSYVQGSEKIVVQLQDILHKVRHIPTAALASLRSGCKTSSPTKMSIQVSSCRAFDFEETQMVSLGRAYGYETGGTSKWLNS